MLSVDECIDKLLAGRNSIAGTEINLPEDAIIRIIRLSRDVFLQQPMLLEIAGFTLYYNSKKFYIMIVILF
jgi:hypothetical protein